MSLSLYDIERSVGIDLLRRPVIATVINASILRFYQENLFIDPDEVQDAAPKNDPSASPSLLQREWVGKLFAVAIVLLTHIVAVLGVAESAMWSAFALFFNLVRLPRIYAFEKLMLDLRVWVARSSVRYVEKKVRFSEVQSWVHELPRMEAHEQGVGGMVVTTVKITDGLSRDFVALLRLVKYWNGWMISYFGEETMVFVGRREEFVRGLCELGKRHLKLDLGWHRDVVERTVFRIKVEFARDLMARRETEVEFIGRRKVSVLVEAEATTSNVELMAHVMDGFASVCETSQRGTRPFNGKRFSIYMIGLAISIALIVFYEGAGGLVKPSADVLTLAIGAYTLWMTVGKSAALGETHEMAEYDVVGRRNLLMAFHGLASLEKDLKHVCWVPEIYRPTAEGEKEEEEEKRDVDEHAELKGVEFDRGDGLIEKVLSESGVSEVFAGRSVSSRSNSSSSISTRRSHRSARSKRDEEGMRDGSISTLEASLCLSIFRHFGCFIRWKSEKLVLDRYVVMVEGEMAHVEGVERLDEIHDMETEHGDLSYGVERIGGNGRGKRRRPKERRRTNTAKRCAQVSVVVASC